jgi:hypothetical protein
MKTLLFLIAITLSFMSNAQEVNSDFWVNDQKGVPKIRSENNVNAYITIAGCIDKELWLDDYSLPVRKLKKPIKGKIWVDTNKTKYFSDMFFLKDSTARMSLYVPDAFIYELRSGKTLYVQWSIQGGLLYTERYSLINVSKTLDRYNWKCIEARPDWFKSRLGRKYLKVIE